MGRGPTTWILAMLLLASCAQAGVPATESAGTTDALPVSRCYLRVTKGAPRVDGPDTIPGPIDSLYIRLDVLGELANGVYKWLPQEKDRMTGYFQGSIDDSLVTAVYTYAAEGKTRKQEVLFKREGKALRVATGEMEESEGVYLFKDKSQVAYGDPIPEVDCK